VSLAIFISSTFITPQQVQAFVPAAAPSLPIIGDVILFDRRISQ